MKSVACLFFVVSLICLPVSESLLAQTDPAQATSAATPQDWLQWRGPGRDGRIAGQTWPDKLDDSTLKKVWSLPLGPSYSGPIVAGDRVFTTETRDKKFEVVTAVDRNTGKVVWTRQWEGSMSVPFFAKANGDWIRATPCYDDGRLYVAGMKDVLVCLNAADGEIIWKIDFPKQTKSEVPSFGFVCSPLVDGDSVYVQAGGGFCKINKMTGEIIWMSLKDGGGMNGSAFSSPVIATISGQRQAVVQTRTDLVGVNLETGDKLWSQEIPSFRGMNIVTPTISKDRCLVSTYGGTTQLIGVAKTGGGFALESIWKLKAEGYMTTPVVVDGFAYTLLRNQRFACFDLDGGVEAWRTSERFGKYVSLVAAGDKILALDEAGKLLLIKANPKAFELLDKREVGPESWAHLAVAGDQLFVRSLSELVMYRWAD